MPITYNIPMIESLLGSKTKEKILLYIYTNKEGYAREISDLFGYALDPVQKQLNKLEDNGVLISRKRGRTNSFSMNPRFPFKKELEALLEKILYFTGKAEKEKYFIPRLRPRRRGKPLWK
jgi:predicted transcriptional regulator